MCFLFGDPPASTYCGALLSSGSTLSLPRSAQCGLTWGWGWRCCSLTSGVGVSPHCGLNACLQSICLQLLFSTRVCIQVRVRLIHSRVCVCVLSESERESERERECMGGLSVFTLTGTNWSKPIPPFYFFCSELLIHVSVTMLPSTPTTAEIA